ncbi:MAG TPA: hypothetical protein VHX38_34580 [Pseudonocardiaceae bacterium]|nr:hypothetical protein [Pseudonocardiaceae bacterium]
MNGSTDTQVVVDHLRRNGIIETGGGVPLPLGIPGVEMHADGELAIEGERCVPQPRVLSDLLRVGGGQGAYLADRAATAAALRAGHDPVLYHAFRDFLPPREKTSDRLVLTAPGEPRPSSTGHIFADLIVYLPGTLPGGEPFRSTGHWNLPGQLELFQTLTGRVLMLVGGRASDGRRFLYEQVCGPGEVMAVPFGVWHVSYVLDGPAVVFNVTTDVGDGQPGHSADPGFGKYERAAPIAITACRRADSHVFTGTPAALRTWGEPTTAPRTDWLAPGLSLADLHLYASPARLADLQQAARDAYRDH